MITFTDCVKIKYRFNSGYVEFVRRADVNGTDASKSTMLADLPHKGDSGSSGESDDDDDDESNRCGDEDARRGSDAYVAKAEKELGSRKTIHFSLLLLFSTAPKVEYGSGHINQVIGSALLVSRKVRSI